MKASINSIETFGAVDGPGVRTVVFFNKCNLRCKFCHNPETWNYQNENYTVDELFNKIIRNKPYFGEEGGVTFSGGEPLLQHKYLYDLCLKLKKEKIHIALDTAGYCVTDYEKLLELVDLVLYDIKDITSDRYKELTGGNIEIAQRFINNLKKYNNKIWIRLVVVPNVHDTYEYMDQLVEYISKNFIRENILKIEFLPYHKIGEEKYKKLGIENPYVNKKAMDNDKCEELYNYFINKYLKETHLQ